jgi:hypothetical protein
MLANSEIVLLPPLPIVIATVSYPGLVAFGTWRWMRGMEEGPPSEAIVRRALAWPRLIARMGLVMCLLGIAGSLDGIREFILDRQLTDHGVVMAEMVYLSGLWTGARCGSVMAGSGYIWLWVLEGISRRRILRRGSGPAEECV